MPLLSILLVEKDDLVIKNLNRILCKMGFDVEMAQSGQQALEITESKKFDLIILDWYCTDLSGLELLKYFKKNDPSCLVSVLVANNKFDDVSAAIKYGACDFIERPVEKDEFKARVLALGNIHCLSSENRLLKSDMKSLHSFSNFIGRSLIYKKVITLSRKVSKFDGSVLLKGEHGTGKDEIAQAIHNASKHSDKPFIKLDCSAHNHQLLESDLFGHEHGSLMGTALSRQGWLREVENGTVYLDEIEALPMKLQAQLADVLETKKVIPVGGVKKYNTKARLIISTYHDLQTLVEQGKFRNDLFMKLNAVEINLPPLRDRVADIPLLCNYFMNRLNKSEGLVKNFSNDAMKMLESYTWPGNISELENTVQRSFAACESGKIQGNDLPEGILNQLGKPSIEYLEEMDGTMQSFEKIAIKSALRRFCGNRKKSAVYLDIGEATLYRKIKEYEIGKVWQ